MMSRSLPMPAACSTAGGWAKKRPMLALKGPRTVAQRCRAWSGRIRVWPAGATRDVVSGDLAIKDSELVAEREDLGVFGDVAHPSNRVNSTMRWTRR
jgi:hypothetical protein